MKTKLAIFAACLTLMVSVSAEAIVIRGWERPVYDAELSATDGAPVQYPVPVKIQMRKLDGATFATSFELTDDSGIRCFRAPCPTFKPAVFKLTEAPVRDIYGTVTYRAIEVRNSTATVGPLRRLLTVVDRTGDQANYPVKWSVTVTSYGQTRTFAGNPNPIYTIQ